MKMGIETKTAGAHADAAASNRADPATSQTLHESNTTGREVYLGILSIFIPGAKYDSDDLGGFDFEILAGNRGSFDDMQTVRKSSQRFGNIWGYKLNAPFLKKVPLKWGDELREILDNRKAEMLSIGYLYYMLRDEDGLTAYSYNYYPKRNLGGKRCQGLPYFIDAILVGRLLRGSLLNMSNGIRYVSTSKDPQEPRIKQLLRVGLPTNQKVEAVDWIRGMGSGIAIRKKEVY